MQFGGNYKRMAWWKLDLKVRIRILKRVIIKLNLLWAIIENN
jgi:hypothetical protein